MAAELFGHTVQVRVNVQRHGLKVAITTQSEFQNYSGDAHSNARD